MVKELLDRIEKLRALELNQEIIEEIISLYDSVCDVTLHNELDLSPILDYITFLCDDLGRFEDALEAFESIDKCLRQTGREVSAREKSELFYLNGKINIGIKSYNHAIVVLDDAKELADELYRAEGASIAALCGCIRNATACALELSGRYKEAFEYYKRAKGYAEIAYEYDSRANRRYLAMIYDNYSSSLDMLGGEDNTVLKYHSRAIEIYSELVIENKKYKANLANCYYSMARYFSKRKDYDKAERYFLESIRMREEIREKNPTAVDCKLSGTYYALGLMYMRSGRGISKELCAMNSAKEIRISLRKQSAIYANELADVFQYLIYDIGPEVDINQRNELRAEYVDALLQSNSLSEKENQNLCEEGYLTAYYMSDVGRYDKALSVLCGVIDTFIGVGSNRWLLSFGQDEIDLLSKLCSELNRPEIYDEYSKKILNLYSNGSKR